VTSGYGIRGGVPHNGVDIAPPCEAPIYAAAAGTVVRAGPSTGYGNLIVVDHGGGTVTRYAHMFNDDVLVAVGQSVSAGQQIARVGTSGDSTGCHLHFEVKIEGTFTSPEPFSSGLGAVLR
jgi:murein DD-endopeptidase MepM/ murein hydrolase activator NlpD